MEHLVTDRVGYIGLGNMGGPIAMHVAREGVDLTVFDLSSSAVDSLLAEGAAAAGSARELAEQTDVVALCVWDDQQVLDVVLGPDGVLVGLSAGKAVIVQSTVLPATIETVAAAARERGVHLIDAPVSGNMADRAGGTLTVLAGGDAEAFARCRPVLEVIGDPVIHLGGPGAGEVTKLINNTLMQASRNVAIELLDLAQAFGISEESLVDAINEGSGGSWVLANWAMFDELLLTGRGVQANQTREALEAASSIGIEMPLTSSILATAVDTAHRRLEQLRSSGRAKS
jgi:3-hydroxyisobutyrate dehydrogenase